MYELVLVLDEIIGTISDVGVHVLTFWCYILNAAVLLGIISCVVVFLCFMDVAAL